MIRLHWITLVALPIIAAAFPAVSLAQPTRQMPGSRPFLPGTPRYQVPEPNSRTKPAASATGLESTDFYPKNGYPKVLGDAVEAGTASGSSGGSAAAGSGGNTGVQSAGSQGFQGNTGNQIGQNGGTTILGNLFGGSSYLNGGVGFNLGVGPTTAGAGLTGGGFSGMVPKGFGFGGTPDLYRKWSPPLTGATGK